MSSSSQERRAQLLGELARELRQFNELGASFFRAAAGRIRMAVTDMQVIDILESTGPTTAGQLADLTGLTTGAITGILSRLEEIGLLRRERDPDDGRRVIVRLAPDNDKMRDIRPVFDSLEKVWDETASHYDDDQIAFLLEFLKRSNATSRKEIVQLREAPTDEGGGYSTPLGDLKSGRLIFPTGAVQLTLRADAGMAELYQARFDGPVPEVKVEDGTVTVRYSRRSLLLDWRKRAAEVSLNAAIPWQIVILGGAWEITARLGNLDLAGLEVKGGLSSVLLELSTPSSVVPIQIKGGASEITMRRPVGVAARVHLKGWATAFVFDDQSFSNVGNDIRLQSPGYEASAPYYDIEVIGSASGVTITSG